MEQCIHIVNNCIADAAGCVHNKWMEYRSVILPGPSLLVGSKKMKQNPGAFFFMNIK